MSPYSLAVACLLGAQASASTVGPERIAPTLRQAAEAWAVGPDALDDWRQLRHEPLPGEGLQVVVEVRPDATVDELLRWLDAELEEAWPELWIDATRAHPGMVQVFVPYDSLLRLGDCPHLARAREPARPAPRYEFTEGYEAMFRTDWHAEGVAGRGVRIAVLDVGFAGHQSLLGDELPSSVETVFFSSGEGSNHGTAVAEVIHDLAPRAELALYAFSTDVEYLLALQDIAETDVDLINGSVGFDNIWPADGTSPYTQAVDSLVSEYDKLYVAAAGNENHRYRVGSLADDGDDLVSIAGMNPVWVATSGGWAQLSFRWSEPMGESSMDLDVLVYDEEGGLCNDEAGEGGYDVQQGAQDPYEKVECYAGTSWAMVNVVANGHDVSGLEGFLYSYGGLDEQDASGSRNLTLPGDTVHGLTVGAVDLPYFDQVAWYSSRGPTEDGRIRPHLVAPSGVHTASYGQGLFGGTSAATPHATGVAALVMHADKGAMDPSELRAWLVDATIDLGAEGTDDESGAGFLTLHEVPWRGCHCSQARTRPVGGFLVAVLCGLVGFRRRRTSR